MKTEPRSKHIQTMTDKETFEWFSKIAKTEHQTLSSVLHLGLKKLKANFKPDEITREVN
ncbi:hypothetical protein KAR91_30380 [Candidatus Pacearchaeota archaeon]|nr:hypothetical protein [Candidatus Pacearchaeota archaeon]